MTAITKLKTLADNLTAKRAELTADLAAARATLEAPPPEPFDEEAARRRGAVALAQDAADGGERLAAVKAEINAERDAVNRAIAADTKARDEARKTAAKREADLVEIDAQLLEVDRLLRAEVAKAGRRLLEEVEAEYRAAIAAVVDAAARRTAALALANDDAPYESARSVGRFALSLPTLGIEIDIPGASTFGNSELRVDREAAGRLASQAHAEMRARILGG
jgi:hypothetical protein